MTLLVKLVTEGKIEEVYKNKYLYFLFQHTCVMSVIFKRKWKQKKMTENSCNYVTDSDEAFSFLSLENNGNRYLDMGNIGTSKEDYSTPRYTDINGVKKLKGKGWSTEGMMRFVILTEKMETMRRENKNLMKDLGESVKLYYILMYQKNKNNQYWSSNDHEDIQKIIEDEKRVTEFLKRTSKKQKQTHPEKSLVVYGENLDGLNPTSVTKL